MPSPNPLSEPRADTARPLWPSAVGLGLLLAGLAALHACSGSTFAVGRIAERGVDRPSESSIQALRLRPLRTFQANDSPAPAWSPDGETLVYSTQWPTQVFTYNVNDDAHTVVYDANTSNLNPDLRANVASPAFLNNHEIIAGPSWPSLLDQADPWSQAIVVDTLRQQARQFGAAGTKPRVSPDGDRVLLTASDGVRMTDGAGNELHRFNSLVDPIWAPDGEGFVALAYDQYQYDNATLVRVDADHNIQRLDERAYEPVWHPEGKGVAFTRPAPGRTWFDPIWDYGTVVFFDFESMTAKPIADNARSPGFASEPIMLFYETRGGLGVTDLQGQTRVLRDTRLSRVSVSPTGGFIAGVQSGSSDPYYPNLEVAVFEIAFD